MDQEPDFLRILRLTWAYGRYITGILLMAMTIFIAVDVTVWAVRAF